jgi:hypothetical protein
MPKIFHAKDLEMKKWQEKVPEFSAEFKETGGKR